MGEVVVAEIGIAEGKSRVFMIEKWESGELLGKHGASDHIKALAASGTL